MIKVKKVFDCNGNVKKEYTLTQGDSFRFKANVKNESQADLIASITFKIANSNFTQIFSKKFVKSGSEWYLIVNSNETINFEVADDYLTEIEVVYADGGNDTLEKGQLRVVNQIVEEG